MSQSSTDTLPPRASHTVLQPAGWPQPKGYANGMKARGDMVFVGGMVGWDENERFPPDFVGQTRQLLKNIATVLAEGGAAPHHIVRMTWFVTDMEQYRRDTKAIGRAYRGIMGKHFPTMSVIGVASLVERDALVEIEATAVINGG